MATADDAPIASLEEPVYVPSSATTSTSIETADAVFPGTDLHTFAYTGATADALRDIIANLAKDPMDSEPCRQYPGPQPVSIDRSHFETVRQRRYALGLKTDGVRAAMLVTDVHGTHTVSLWDRTMSTPYGLSIRHVPRVMYQVGSLLDGELVFDRVRSRWTYVIFDVHLIGGLPQYHKMFWDRLDSATKTLGFSYHESPEDTVVLLVKEFVSLHEAPVPGNEALLESEAFPSDGYILMPVDTGIVFGHHKFFYKLKTCHSVDFVHKNGSLFVFNTQTKRLVKAGVLAPGSPVLPENSIVECVLGSYHPSATKRTWKYLTTRTDKSTSNTLFTMEKTLLNIEENLGYADIRALAPIPS